jgi:glycosyltransferase involved in cell wall biosynthesis
VTTALGNGERVVFVTQLVDEDDPVLGAVVGMARALAARCDDFVVVANEVRQPRPGFAVQSLGKERGAGHLRRGLRYVRAILRATRTRPAVIVCHMCPVYANLAAPIARLRRVPILLWFAHPADSRALALADRLVDASITSLPGSYPRPSRATHVIGQAIDTARFEDVRSIGRTNEGIRLMAIGRTSPSKNLDVVIHSTALLRERRVPFTLSIVGGATSAQESAERARLTRLVEALGVADVVSFESPVPFSAMPALLQNADVVVNATRAGSGDKTVFEAMAAGRPVLVSNPSFAELLAGTGTSFQDGDPVSLADAVEALARRDDLDALGEELRRRVRLHHDVDHWADGVMRVAGAALVGVGR